MSVEEPLEDLWRASRPTGRKTADPADRALILLSALPNRPVRVYRTEKLARSIHESLFSVMSVLLCFISLQKIRISEVSRKKRACSAAQFLRAHAIAAMIAATARVHNLIVVTRNVADFKQFKVEVLNPFQTPRK